MDSGTTSNSAYFALRLNNTFIATKDPTILSAVAFPNHSNFTIEAWVQPDERTDLDDHTECVVVRQAGVWELGFLGDGRLYGRWIYQSAGQVLSVTLPSPNSLNLGSWLYVSLTVSAVGQLSLYSSDVLLAQSPIQTGLQFSAHETADNAVELGGDFFAGRLRNVTLSNRCKQVIRDSKDPSQNVNDFTESMFHASMHMLVPNAVAAINLLHPMGDPNNPSSAVPLCCLHLPAGPDGLPTMTPIMVPNDPAIQLQSLTGSRYLTSGGYIDCGLGVMTQQNMTFEAWIMPGGPAGLPLGNNSYVLASCASLGDPGHFYNTNGSMAGWDITLTTSVPLSTQKAPTVTLEFFRGGVNNAGGWLAKADLGILEPGRWLHVTISGNPLPYATVNGKQILPFACPYNFVGTEANHFPLLIGGEATQSSWQTVKYKTGVPLTMSSPFEGAIKMVRIWRRALSVAEITDIYSLQQEVDDYTQLALYLDCDSDRVMDLCMKVNVVASTSVFHQAAVTTAIPVPINGGHITDEQLLNMMGKETQSRSRPNSARSAFDPDQPLLISFLGADNPWLNVIDCTASIVFVMIDLLTGAKLKLKKMADVLTWVFFRLGTRFALYIKRIVDAPGAFETMHACLDIMYFAYNQGILKEIFLCFDFSYFALLKLLPRFVPYVGTVKLVADLLQAAVDITRVITGFEKRSAPKLQPLTMLLQPDPLTDRQILFQGQTMSFKAFLDHQPASRQNMPVTLKSHPQGALIVNPSSFMLDEKDWKFGVPLTISAANYAGSASIQTADGNKHIEFLVRPPATLEIVPKDIVSKVATNGTTWSFQATLIWEGPTEQTPVFTYKFTDDDGTAASNVSVTTVSESSDPVRMETRTSRKRKQIQVEFEAKQTAKKLAIQASAAQGGTATATVTKKDPEEWVNIYMINAGHGDAFYLHFKKKDYRADKDGVEKEIFYEATMIIDGGAGASRGELMWHEIAPSHLPRQLAPPAPARANVDLVICTHQDNDHINGLIWMYDRMRNGVSLGPAGTETIKPSMTWLNAPYIGRQRSNRDGDGSVKDLTARVEDLSIATDPQPWPIKSPHDRERAGDEAESLVGLLGTWPKSVAPAAGASPQSIIDAGVTVEYRAPNAAQVQTARQLPSDGRIVNSASIVNEIEATNTAHYWNSLWTGDAWDKEDNPATRESIGLFKRAKKHYTIMKVGHHGSFLSNCEQFFADVTADHYLISSEDHSNNPRRETIQWILDGHAKMRAANAALTPAIISPPPKIWISNPIDQEFSFDFKEGEIWQRNQSIDGINLTRKGKYGYLYFQIHNGSVVVTPTEAAITINTTDPNAPTRNTVVPFTKVKKIALRAVDFDNHEPWIPLTPNDRSQLGPEEIQDLDANATNAFFLRLTCSQSFGQLLPVQDGDGGAPTVRFQSDLSAICTAGHPPTVDWVGGQFDMTNTGAKTWFDSIAVGTGLPQSPAILAYDINDGEFVNAVDVYATGPNPGGLLMYTNQGRRFGMGGNKSGNVKMQMRPPDASFGLVGFRRYFYSGDWVRNNGFRSDAIVGRFSVIWAPMQDSP